MGQRFSIYLLTTVLLLVPSISFGGDSLATPLDTASIASNTEALLDLSLDDLMNITVTTTSKTEEKLSEAAGVISVMTQDELERFGARTLKDILMRMPSINLSTIYLTDRSCISMRGDQNSSAANHILLLINGRPVREAEEGGIKSEILESFPISSIEQLEVIRGPGSVLYGSNAFSGVINVITKKTTDNKAEIRLNGGIPGTFQGMVNARYQINDFGFVLGGQYKNARPWNVRFQARDTVFRDFSIPDKGAGVYGELSFKGIRYMTSYNQWQNYYAMQKYIPADSSNINAVKARVVGRQTYGEVLWDKWFNDLGFTHKFSEIWDMTLNATYTQSWLKADSFPAPHRNSFDLTGEWTNFLHPIKDLNITLGVLGNLVKGEEKSGLPLGTTIDTTQNTFSGYIQGDYKIISQIKVIAGIQANKAAGIDLDINPRLGIIWSPDNIVNVKALYSTAFRAPSMMELYLKHPTLKGNPTLKPEKIRTVDLGANIQTNKVSLGINNYFSQIRNNIALEQKTVPPIYYQNYKIPTTIFGMEIEGKLFITKELMLTGSGLYQKNTTGDSAGNMMPVPEASAKGGISYSNYGLTASIFNIYEGKLDKRYNATFNKTRNAFDLLDLNIKFEFDKAFNWKIPQLAIHFDCYNLLDEEVWLPATGQLKNYTLPQIEGRSIYFGIDVGF
jgi:outer membrane receptor for ferrienterochelin and colicin